MEESVHRVDPLSETLSLFLLPGHTRTNKELTERAYLGQGNIVTLLLLGVAGTLRTFHFTELSCENTESKLLVNNSHDSLDLIQAG